MNSVVLLAIALAPGAAIGLYIYFKDKYEREPVGLVVASFFMGVVAVAVQFYAREGVSRKTLRRMFGITLTTLGLFGFALVVGYVLWVTQVPIRGGEARVSFVTGDVRLPTCRCGTLSDQECIEMTSMNTERNLDTQLSQTLSEKVTTEEVTLLGIYPFQLGVRHGGSWKDGYRTDNQRLGESQICWSVLALG